MLGHEVVEGRREMRGLDAVEGRQAERGGPVLEKRIFRHAAPAALNLHEIGEISAGGRGAGENLRELVVTEAKMAPGNRRDHRAVVGGDGKVAPLVELRRGETG